MKKLIRLSVLFAAASLFLVVPVADVAADPIDDPAVQAFIAKGDELAAEGRFGSARGQYKQAVAIQRAQGELPDIALRRIANTYYFQDRYQAAGATLVDLAEEAAEYGDIGAEIWAYADAAWIAGAEANKQVVDRHTAKVDKLLKSPYLPEDIKAKVRETRLASAESVRTVALTP